MAWSILLTLVVNTADFVGALIVDLTVVVAVVPSRTVVVIGVSRPIVGVVVGVVVRVAVEVVVGVVVGVVSEFTLVEFSSILTT